MSPKDWCVGHIPAITHLLIDSVCASSWGTQGPAEREQRRMEERQRSSGTVVRGGDAQEIASQPA